MESRVLPPSTRELNLLLEWPGGRTRPQWIAIFSASIVFHIIVFSAAMTIPSLIGQRQPEQIVVVRHIRLYLPPDVMTQKAPNRQKVTKQIDLADLVASQTAIPSRGRRSPSVRRREIPKQAVRQEVAKNAPPQILAQAPSITTDATSARTAGTPGSLPASAPPPPSPTQGPFQNIGGDVSPNPNPKLLPPRGAVDTSKELAPSPNGRELSLSDDNAGQSMPGSPGALAQAPAQHAAVELQSDANGADFKIYLKTILAIVRANWHKVLPESARMGTLRGRTVLEFIIDRDGSIPKLVTADSSGSEPLDRAAVAGLSMSNPLPPLPADFKGFQVRLAFTFAYNMPAQ